MTATAAKVSLRSRTILWTGNPLGSRGGLFATMPKRDGWEWISAVEGLSVPAVAL